MTALAVGFYCIQLYCDFSGGIDITRGVAQMLGIHLEENFRRPIFAASLSEYWRRWHMTLGSWMKDYLFYPSPCPSPLDGWENSPGKNRRQAGKDPPHFPGNLYRLLCHRNLARRQFSLHRLWPLERCPHYRVLAAGQFMDRATQCAAHLRLQPWLAGVPGPADHGAGIHRTLSNPSAPAFDGTVHAVDHLNQALPVPGRRRHHFAPLGSR